MSDDIARLIESAVRKVEATKRTEAKLAEAMRKQDEQRVASEGPHAPARSRGRIEPLIVVALAVVTVAQFAGSVFLILSL